MCIAASIDHIADNRLLYAFYFCTDKQVIKDKTSVFHGYRTARKRAGCHATSPLSVGDERSQTEKILVITELNRSLIWVNIPLGK
ncbi:MAG TPA: hypothetical protein PK261_03760, partial [Accumulibacter sp.]|nr:hypothetical protein [Accumulibacter sp.]